VNQIILIGLCISFGAVAKAENLIIHLSGVEEAKGELRVGLFDEFDPKKSKPIAI